MFTFSGPLEDETLLPSFQGVPRMPDLLQQRPFPVFRVSLLQQLYQFLGMRTVCKHDQALVADVQKHLPVFDN
jgi:hypothetical protein